MPAKIGVAVAGHPDLRTTYSAMRAKYMRASEPTLTCWRISPRYDRKVQRLRGFLRSEIGRVLNRLVDVHAPETIVVEMLDFRHPYLSRRLSRLLSNSGRSIVREKLQDLHEKYGIRIVEVNAAYSSQECGGCGYVDKKNRTGEQLHCLWCGKKQHADVNASRNQRARSGKGCSLLPPLLAVGSVALPKAGVLRVLVRHHTERLLR